HRLGIDADVDQGGERHVAADAAETIEMGHTHGGPSSGVNFSKPALHVPFYRPARPARPESGWPTSQKSARILLAFRRVYMDYSSYRRIADSPVRCRAPDR